MNSTDPFDPSLPEGYLAQQYKEREQCRVINMPHPHEVFLAEIDQLRALLVGTNGNVAELMEQRADFAAEVERQAEATRHWIKQAHDAQAEVRRLLAALRAIAAKECVTPCVHFVQVMSIARQALDRKSDGAAWADLQSETEALDGDQVV